MYRALSLAAALLLVPATLTGCGRADAVRVATAVDQAEANEIWVALHAAGVKGVTQRSTTHQRETVLEITVPASEEARARDLLHQYGLPRKQRVVGGDSGGAFGSFPSRGEQQARLVEARQNSVSRMLEAYDRVTRAEVLIVPSPETEFGQPMGGRASASVVIKYLPREAATVEPTMTTSSPMSLAILSDPAPTPAASADDDEEFPVSRRDVQELVARCVEGLNVADVSVRYTASVGWPRSSVESGASIERPTARSLFPLPTVVWILAGTVATLGAGLVAALGWLWRSQRGRGPQLALSA